MAERDGRSSGDAGTGLRPGQIVAGRYRIHRLLGKGGMGEVYRADDLTLGRYVALKFPIRDGRAAAGLSHRLAAEVAVAQRVSHPNVCRVHELGRHGERVFLSMQLIEGETLSTILARTVGTLTAEEKLRIAHDLCAALTAIHAEGIVYRDLKPTNVMLGPDGRASITDFGLAVFGCAGDPGSGTFDYMAPEQHSGDEPSSKSDLYALGLVLHEVFTGRPAFQASSKQELARRKLDGPPELRTGDEVEPEVREVILRCLAPEPEGRPGSADAVAAALPARPGRGSPAGGHWTVPPQTLLVSPRWSPRPWCAHAMLATVALALVSVAALAPYSQSTRAAELGDPPQALEVRAREVIAAAGLGPNGGREEARDGRRSGGANPWEGVFGFTGHPRRLDRVAAPGHGPDPGPRVAAVPVPPVLFWYRQDPLGPLPVEAGSPFRRYDDPPLATPGMVGVHLHPDGRLLRLDAVPPPYAAPEPEGSTAAPPPPDWRPLFVAAGLELERFRPVAPSWTPPVFADQRWAWDATAPRAGALPVRIEAASFRGTPVSFRRIEPWMVEPTRERKRRADVGVIPSRTGRALAGLWFAGVLVGGVLLARRNLFRRIADPRAAFRLAVAVLAARTLVWLLGAEHPAGPAALQILGSHLARALLAAAQVGVIYLALEPFVRRFWPELTASWVRLVYGRVRDPLVGFHLLAGALFGTAAVLWSRSYAAFAGRLGLPAPRPDALDTIAWMVQIRGLDLQCEALRGLRQALAVEVLALVHGVMVSFFAVVGVVLLRLVLKRPVLSRTLAAALFVAVLFPFAGHPLADGLVAAVAVALWLTALVRFGFLAATTATACAWLLSSHPLTLDVSAWYAPGATIALLAVAALAVYGFRISLAGRSALPEAWLALDVPGATGPF